MALAETVIAMPSTAGVGFGVGMMSRSGAPQGLAALKGQTPEELLVCANCWSWRRIAAELGISRNTLDRYLRLGEWQPYRSANRSGQLEEHREWLQQQFEQHHGNAEVVRQELVKQKGLRVSLRTVERAVQAWREALWQNRQATVRYETPPGKQLQADFGELWVPIGGVRTWPQGFCEAVGAHRRPDPGLLTASADPGVPAPAVTPLAAGPGGGVPRLGRGACASAGR